MWKMACMIVWTTARKMVQTMVQTMAWTMAWTMGRTMAHSRLRCRRCRRGKSDYKAFSFRTRKVIAANKLVRQQKPIRAPNKRSRSRSCEVYRWQLAGTAKCTLQRTLQSPDLLYLLLYSL